MKNVYGLLLFIAGLSIASTSNPKTIIQTVEVVKTDTVQILVPTSAEVYLLARLIESESSRSTKGIERIAGRIANGNVVISRMQDAISRGTLTTLTKTIYRRNQFCGVKTQRFKESPSKESLIAATYAILDISILPDNILYFNTPTAPNVWNKTQLKEWARFAGHSYKYRK